MPAPLQTFIIYARADEEHKRQLLLHLRPLVSSRLINVWHDGQIQPGEDWEKAIKTQLKASDIVLLLVSANAMSSEFIQSEELQTALDRLQKGQARVVPILVSPYGWKHDPVINKLQILPLFRAEGPKAVSDGVWKNEHEAWAVVVESLGDMIEDLNDQREKAEQLAAEQAAAAETARQRQAEEAQREREARAERQEAERSQTEEQRRQREAETRAEAERREQEQRRAEAERQKREDAERAAAERREQDARLQEAEEKRRREREDAERTAWRAAQTADTIEAYEDFLVKHPNSLYVRDGRYRVKELRRERKKPMPLWLFAGIGGGVLVLVTLVVFWSKGGMTKQQAIASIEQSMVPVEGGTFTMGNTVQGEKGDIDECPHQVTVGKFSIGKYEVTQIQWKTVMGNNPSCGKDCDDCPVECVSWDQAQAFIQKLNQLTGKTYRLPTEAEWEFAARGGNAGQKDNFIYAGSNELEGIAWYSFFNLNQETHPVGQKKPNQLGLYDMCGNVREWCEDIYKNYPGCTVDRECSNCRVWRGGAWYDNDNDCHVSSRDGAEPDFRNYGGGFRLSHGY